MLVYNEAVCLPETSCRQWLSAAKIEAVQRWKIPENKKQVHLFLDSLDITGGLSQIMNFFSVATPLQT